MRLKNLLRLGKNSDDRFSDFMLSENLVCEVVCAETDLDSGEFLIRIFK